MTPATTVTTTTAITSTRKTKTFATTPSAGNPVTKPFSRHSPIVFASIEDKTNFETLLSLEMAIKFIHLNKEAVKRNCVLSPPNDAYVRENNFIDETAVVDVFVI
jgi:hypothetical protein